MSKQSTTSTQSPDPTDIADEIASAIATLRDLLKLALQEAPAESDSPCKAGSAIRAAGRYVDDIEKLNERLFECKGVA